MYTYIEDIKITDALEPYRDYRYCTYFEPKLLKKIGRRTRIYTKRNFTFQPE